MKMTDKQTRFILAQAANAAERVAAMLERMAEAQDCEKTAERLEIAASDLAHHADAIREASGINAATEANLAALIANPSTR
jgi:cytochrome c1